MTTPYLQIQGLRMEFGKVVAVHDVTLDIRQGEFLTFLGPSGSGKSTTLYILAGFQQPTRGDILLNGRTLLDRPSHQRNIGMVFQRYTLFPNMTVGENVAFPLKVRRRPKAEIDAKVRETVEAISQRYAAARPAPRPRLLPTRVEAASLPETFFTVWSNVFDRGRLQAGETLLIQGGTSGIGVTAIQLAKARGARVIVTAGSDDKCAACLKLGADHAINYKTQDFVQVCKELTDGRGVDVVLDMVAGGYVAREVEALAEDGRIVIIAVQGGVKAEFNAGMVLRKRLTITGSTLRPRPVAFKAAIARSLREQVWPALARRDIAPIIFATFPAEQAAQAHALMESGQHVGKIVLTW